MNIITEDVYEKLRKIMNKFVLKVPKHEKLTDFLKECFTVEEAELLTHFTAPMIETLSAKKLAQRANLPEEKVTEMMEQLAKRGVVMREVVGKKEKKMYSLMTFFPGLYEFFFVAHKEHTPEQNKRAAEFYEEYYNSIYHKEVGASEFPFHRVLPSSAPVEHVKKLNINENIEPKQEILPFEVVSDYIATSSRIGITMCQCRFHNDLLGRKECDKQIDETCLALGIAADFLIKMGHGRLISKEEAMDILKKCEENGMVHTTMNVRSGQDSLFICNCCPDCCVVLRELSKYENPLTYAISNFKPIFNLESCKKCGTCVKICPLNALELIETKDGKMLNFNEEKCFGCGLCASSCPHDAVKLEKIRDQIPAESLGDLLVKVDGTRVYYG
ncbi:MAG: 4Fe-4S dicluster domain-containing protein [Candidatus Lokiarchaeota archaeon]|nr:4Fe-4S dicluster domain-containing protein [Candidatus Lokiarchaeota archaeon]